MGKFKRPSYLKCGDCNRFVNHLPCSSQPETCGPAFEDISELASPSAACYVLRYQSGVTAFVSQVG